jgi:hypothetical protein
LPFTFFSKCQNHLPLLNSIPLPGQFVTWCRFFFRNSFYPQIFANRINDGIEGAGKYKFSLFSLYKKQKAWLPAAYPMHHQQSHGYAQQNF